MARVKINELILAIFLMNQPDDELKTMSKKMMQ